MGQARHKRRVRFRGNADFLRGLTRRLRSLPVCDCSVTFSCFDADLAARLLNTLHSSPVVRPDVRGQDYNSSLNITKFLTTCTAHGFPQSDLFLPLDLIEASGYSLARVASTVISLVQFSESSPQSATPKALPFLSDDDTSAIHRATEDLEEWVEHFIALTRQKMISDQLANTGLDESVAEQDSEFVSFIVARHLASCSHVTTVEQQGGIFEFEFSVD